MRRFEILSSTGLVFSHLRLSLIVIYSAGLAVLALTACRVSHALWNPLWARHRAATLSSLFRQMRFFQEPPRRVDEEFDRIRIDLRRGKPVGDDIP